MSAGDSYDFSKASEFKHPAGFYTNEQLGRIEWVFIRRGGSIFLGLDKINIQDPPTGKNVLKHELLDGSGMGDLQTTLRLTEVLKGKKFFRASYESEYSGQDDVLFYFPPE